jgi:hypothetical protein
MRRIPAALGVALTLTAGTACTAAPAPPTATGSTPAVTPARPGTPAGPADLPATGATIARPDLTMPRAAHTATRLPDGRVLIAGGCTLDGCGGTPAGGRTEIYDPRRRRFEPGPAMVTGRAGHTATALEDGRVLIVGGYPDEGRPPLASIEAYDPRSGRFTEVASMSSARGAHTATRLADGRVLIVGGIDGRRALSSVELFDPATNRVTAAAALPAPKATHGAARLTDGRVLVAGGQTGVGHGNGLTDTAYVYDPADNRWKDLVGLSRPAYKLALAPLPGGGAIVVGGQLADDPASRLATTQIYEHLAGAFRPGPTMSEPRYKISDAVVALPDGRVVIAGGFGVDVYQRGRLAHVAGSDGHERQMPAAVALDDGTVLVTGGYDDRTRVTASAIVVEPGHP